MSDLNLIIDFHLNSERQGPGSVEDTLKALSFINSANNTNLKVADIGCGSGGQTITLAQNLNAEITAIDLFPEFLGELNDKAKKLGLTNEITTLKASMDDLPFDKEEFDIIWSEGAIYNMGFESGIKNWKKFLKPGGYLAVSEITWIMDSRPKTLEDFWTKEYSEMDIASNKIKILEENGFTLTGYFFLDESSWIENYYKPLESNFDSYLERNNHSEQAKEVVQEYKSEIELYHKYKDYYSYGFYVARKN